MFLGEASALIAKAHLPVPATGAPEQGVTAGTSASAVAALIAGLEQHRFTNRNIETVRLRVEDDPMVMAGLVPAIQAVVAGDIALI